MDSIITLIGVVLGLVLVALSIYFDKRRRRVYSPSPIPILPMLFVGAIITLLSVLHLITIWRGYR